MAKLESKTEIIEMLEKLDIEVDESAIRKAYFSVDLYNKFSPKIELQQWLDNSRDFIETHRFCDECGTEMYDGFVIDDGAYYYCDKPCLHKHYTMREFLDMYDSGNGDSYYTEWY